MSVSKKAIVGTLWLSTASYIVFAIEFVVGIILARLLVPKDFGVVALAITILTFFQILSGWGFNAYIIKEQKDLEKVIYTLFSIMIATSLFIVLILFSASLILLEVYEKEMIIVLLVIAPFDTIRLISTIASDLIQKSLLFEQNAIINLSSTIISSIVALIMVFSGFGIWSLVFRYITRSLTLSFLAFRFCPYELKLGFDKKIAKDFFYFGRNLFVNNVSEVIVTKADNLVIGSLAGTTNLGFYTKGYTMSEIFSKVFLPPINRAVFPTFSAVQKDRAKLSKTYNIVTWFVIRVTVPVCLVLGVFAPEIIVFLIGEKWLPMVPLFRALLIAGILRSILELNSYLHLGVGDSATVARVRISEVLFFVPGIIIFVYLWGTIGASVCVNIMFLLGVALILHSARRIVDFSLLELFYIPVIAAGVSFLIFCLLRPKIFIFSSMGNVLFSSIVLLIVFASILFIVEGEKIKTNVEFIYDTMTK